MAPVGASPRRVAVDEGTNTVYVTNAGSNTVTVLNGRTCNGRVHRGCGTVPSLRRQVARNAAKSHPIGLKSSSFLTTYGGTPPEARPTVEPPVTDLSALHLESTLPSLPAAALEVLRVCQDPEAEIDALAQALERDPMLAGRVLRVANSAFYHRRSEVTTLRGAAMVLGMRALKIVALGFTLANELPRRGVTAGLDLGMYWHRSLVNGVIARSLARAVNRSLVEEAFLCGLLSEIGKLALTHAIPDEYAPGRGGGRRLAVRGARARAARLHLRRGRRGDPAQLAGARGRRRRRAYAGRVDALPGTAPVDGCRLADLVGLARLGTAALFGADTGSGLILFTEEAEQRFGLAAR